VTNRILDGASEADDVEKWLQKDFFSGLLGFTFTRKRSSVLDLPRAEKFIQ
jgi:hypothetical protein